MGRYGGQAEITNLMNVFVVVHNEYMSKSAAITIRVPAALKRKLESRAEAQHRSLSAQVIADLERALEQAPPEATKGRFLGLFVGTAVPTDDDIEEVRGLLWGDLGRLERYG